MTFAAYRFFRIGFLVLVGNGQMMSAPIERSVSASRQFIVYGVTGPLRGAVAEAAENAKANVLNLLQQRDEWKVPIILNLKFPQANVPDESATALRFSQTGAGLKIQLDLTIAADFEPLALRRQLLRVLLLEMAYRQLPELAAGSFYVEPPDWLLEGLLGADPLNNRAGMVAAVDSLVTDDRVASLDEFLRQKLSQLDSPGELLYRAYAFSFLHLLLKDTAGPARLSNYVANLSRTSTDPISDLKVFFPVLAGGPEIDRLWKEAVAGLKSRQYELLTAAETERQLEQLVSIRSPSGPAAGAPNLAEFAKKKKLSKPEAAELRHLKAQLVVLAAEGNPILRTLVAEYRRIAERILAHKVKGVAARLDSLAAKRREIGARAGDIDDYMNWFEVTNSGANSGAFTGYLRAVARSRDLQSRRRDPLSVYLDSLEEQF